MGSLLIKVKAKMTIYAHDKVRGLLEGEYGSVFKGRSMDFDDLRQYVPGDDIKDIDWKATARSGQTLIKRYIAIRKHNILLVVDTGRNMAAESASQDNKREVAIMTAGVMGYIAQKHGDLVAMVSGDNDGTQYIPLKGSNEHLERILQHMQKKISLGAAPSNLTRQLEYVARSIRRRMMLIIISDDLSITAEHDPLLRRLGAQHEIMWVTIGDADLTGDVWQSNELFDVATNIVLPSYIRSNKKIKQEFIQATTNRRDETRRLLERLNITSERVTGESDVVAGLFKLLERHRYAKRR